MVSVQEPTLSDAPRATVERPSRGPWWWVPGAITVIAIASVIVVTLSQLHPSLLLTNTTTTGGDTGAHIATPKYLQTLLTHGQLTGWDPGWYDGFPLYTFYFTLPDLFIAIGGWVIPYDVAFKLGTILGSVLLPIAAWACGRFFRLRPPIPTLMALATLPFLFDYTFTIYGGNLFSTLAGEYAFSLSLAAALVFLGLFACAVREGRYRGWAAGALAVCILSHIVPAFYALGGAAVLTVIELVPRRWGIDDGIRSWPNATVDDPVPRRRTLWWAGSTVGIGLLLCSWWLVPFALDRAYANSMNYQNLNTFWSLLFPEADAWVLVLAAIGVLTAIVVRSRFGLTVTALGLASALALVFDPQGSLYNVRLLPLWFISVYLMGAWAFGTVCISWAKFLRRGKHASTGNQWFAPASGRSPRWAPAAVGGAVVGLLATMAVVVPPFIVPASSLPVTLGANQVTNWSNDNYAGYEQHVDNTGSATFPEYHAIIQTMERVTKRYGCGRTMWEYSENENRFGTPEALMLLPYWTNGCVDSMEGLLFESSATTPYHFINQAELSQSPSQPQVGLPYGPLDVTLGVQHLQLLGVKYFLAESPAVEQMAAADPALKLVARTGPWTWNYTGSPQHTTWDVYVVRNSALVTPLQNDPVVLSGVKAAPGSWLGQPYQAGPSLSWYDDPSRWGVELAQSGPTSWPSTSVNDIRPAIKPAGATRVTSIRQTNSSISFHVSRTGTPVLVKVSYFPNWHAGGADGPYRVTPNLMVVVPTSHDVTLTYGRSVGNDLGQALTAFGLVLLIALFVVPAVRRWRVKPRAAS